MSPSHSLTPAQARVLGSLLEKQAATPDLYPLSLNALAAACNQRSSRDPVMDLAEDDLREALEGLQQLRLAGPARSMEGRVAKFEHWLGEVFNFTRAESALLCVLLLRGPQTPGELRGRTERLHRFDEGGDVLAGLQKLMERDPPLAAVLPRQPGSRESRYAQLLSGAVEAGPPVGAPTYPDAPPAASSAQQDRIRQLEATVAELQREVAALRQKIDDLFA
ncbi:MAG TPA: YceH family protein [Terracidiphilus sp.]|nr:YceH family protein [Terracidiphilus sp.]